MKFEFPKLSKEKKIETPELTAFAQYLVDNKEVQDQVFSYIHQMQTIAVQPDMTLIDRRDLGLIESALSDILNDAHVEVPAGVTASEFATELQNKLNTGDTYVPVWQREKNDVIPESENMKLTTCEALVVLYRENETASVMIQKYYTGKTSFDTLHQAFIEAGYILDTNFKELLTEARSKILEEAV